MHKYFIEFTLGWFTFGGGWYSGEEPVLFEIRILERFYPGSWSVVDIKVFKFSLFVNVYFDKDAEDEYVWLPLEMK